MSARVVMHVQHLLGSGHLRRITELGAALARRGARVTVLSGGMPVAGTPENISLIQLPILRCLDARFLPLDEHGDPITDAWRAHRRAATLAAIDDGPPDILLTELFPVGRRVLGFELIPLLAKVRAMTPRPLMVCSLRDIVSPPSTPRHNRRAVARLEAFYDAVLVHGDPSWCRLEDSWPAAAGLRCPVIYTGYVARRGAAHRHERRGVVISAGGGGGGDALLRCALDARALCSGSAGEEPWRVVCGWHLPEESLAALQTAAPAGVVVERARADLPDLLASATVSVSRAGYNTVAESLAAGTAMVVAPFAEQGETEQTMRAAMLRARGRAEVVDDASLTPLLLANAIDRAIDAASERGGFAADADLSGADTAADWLLARHRST